VTLKPFAVVEKGEILQYDNDEMGHYGKSDEALCILPDAEFLDLFVIYLGVRSNYGSEMMRTTCTSLWQAVNHPQMQLVP
jgi:hypothetical protein